jgi:hypothetical protein
MKRKGCVSCGGTYRDRRLNPFCSIVCRTLGQAGLGWRLNPYRIVDLESGIVLSTGPRFDLTPKGLAYLQNLAERLRQPVPEQNTLSPTEPMLPQASPGSSALTSAVSGSAI